MSQKLDTFVRQAGPPGYYRWRIATDFLHLPSYLSGPVLDVGAQNGAFLEQINAEFKVGVDLFEVPVSSQVWCCADACHLPFDDHSFTHVLAFDIIEHVVDDETMLAEVGRILKPGGYLWLSTPQIDFYLFPGNGLQRRFETAWGHVRRGYSNEELWNKLPPRFEGTIHAWSEPAFRYSYIFLKVLHGIAPRLAGYAMHWIYTLDSHASPGKNGHWVACLQKTSETGT